MLTYENLTVAEILAMSSLIEDKKIELIADLQGDTVADPDGDKRVFTHENSPIFAVERESDEVIIVSFKQDEYDDLVIAFPHDHVLVEVEVDRK